MYIYIYTIKFLYLRMFEIYIQYIEIICLHIFQSFSDKEK